MKIIISRVFFFFVYAIRWSVALHRCQNICNHFDDNRGDATVDVSNGKIVFLLVTEQAQSTDYFQAKICGLSYPQKHPGSDNREPIFE